MYAFYRMFKIRFKFLVGFQDCSVYLTGIGPVSSDELAIDYSEHEFWYSSEIVDNAGLKGVWFFATRQLNDSLEDIALEKEAAVVSV